MIILHIMERRVHRRKLCICWYQGLGVLISWIFMSALHVTISALLVHMDYEATNTISQRAIVGKVTPLLR